MRQQGSPQLRTGAFPGMALARDSPPGSRLIDAAVATYCAPFMVSALLASWVSAALKRGATALREAHDQLESRVAERPADLQKSNALPTSLFEQGNSGVGNRIPAYWY